MEALWDTVDPMEQDALRHLLYALNVMPYDELGPADQVADFFVPYDPLEDITPVLVGAMRVYAIGGYDGRTILSSGEVLDLRTMAWSPLPSMATKRYGHVVVQRDSFLNVF